MCQYELVRIYLLLFSLYALVCLLLSDYCTSTVLWVFGPIRKGESERRVQIMIERIGGGYIGATIQTTTNTIYGMV